MITTTTTTTTLVVLGDPFPGPEMNDWNWWTRTSERLNHAHNMTSAIHWRLGDVMVANITFFIISAVFDVPVLSTHMTVNKWLNCSLFYLRAYRLGVYYFLSLTLLVRLSVCLFVTLLLHIDSSFFCFSMESSHFWPSSLHVALYKTLFYDFWFRSPYGYAQNLLPKICRKSPICWLVWQIDRRYLGLPGGFREWPIQWSHAKCCRPNLVDMATTFVIGAEI